MPDCICGEPLPVWNPNQPEGHWCDELARAATRRCLTPGECRPSCEDPECFKAKVKSIRMSIGRLKGARQ